MRKIIMNRRLEIQSFLKQLEIKLGDSYFERRGVYLESESFAIRIKPYFTNQIVASPSKEKKGLFDLLITFFSFDGDKSWLSDIELELMSTTGAYLAKINQRGQTWFQNLSAGLYTIQAKQPATDYIKSTVDIIDSLLTKAIIGFNVLPNESKTKIFAKISNIKQFLQKKGYPLTFTVPSLEVVLGSEDNFEAKDYRFLELATKKCLNSMDADEKAFLLAMIAMGDSEIDRSKFEEYQAKLSDNTTYRDILIGMNKGDSV